MSNTNTPYNKESSHYKGVSYHKHAKQWYARIKIGGQVIRIGTFTDEIACANAYNYFIENLYKDSDKPLTLNDVPYMPIEEWNLYRTSRKSVEAILEEAKRWI